MDSDSEPEEHETSLFGKEAPFTSIKPRQNRKYSFVVIISSILLPTGNVQGTEPRPYVASVISINSGIICKHKGSANYRIIPGL